MNVIIAQILALIVGVFYLLEDRATENNKILLYNGISNVLIATEYFLLGAISGGICNIAAALRNIYIYKSKGPVHIVVLISYFLFVIAINIGSYDGILSFLPVLLVIMYTSAIQTKNVKIIKYAVIVAYIIEIIYDFYYMAYVSMFICIVGVIIAALSLKKIKE